MMSLGRTVYELDATKITLADVVAWAFISDAGEFVRAQLAEKCSCQTLADERDDELPDGEVQRAANAWRSARGVTTADATRACFEAAGVTPDDLGAYAERTLWHARLAGETRPSVEMADVAEVFADELFFEGKLDALVRAHALRAVVPRLDVSDERIAEAKAAIEARAEWAVVFGTGISREGAARLLEQEAIWSCRQQAIVSVAEVERAVAERRDELRKVVVTTVEAWSLDCAKELFLAVRDDGKTLDEAAAIAALQTKEEEWLVADLGNSLLGARLLGAAVGRVFLPEVGSPLVVRQVKKRVEASARDPAIHDVVVRRLLEERLGLEVSRRVTWANEA